MIPAITPTKKNSLLPNKIQLLAELSYSFVSKMINDTAGTKAKPYFAFIFSLVVFETVKEYGIIPSILQKRTNINSENIKAK
jgi:F-type H+-transporting ATPase subunit a